jgi:hypothetical protein
VLQRGHRRDLRAAAASAAQRAFSRVVQLVDVGHLCGAHEEVSPFLFPLATAGSVTSAVVSIGRHMRLHCMRVCARAPGRGLCRTLVEEDLGEASRRPVQEGLVLLGALAGAR